jgi:hypothetical protein
LGRLALKELRETLRDRRTIITLVVMPLLIYPLLALVFQRFLLTSIKVSENIDYVIGVESEGIAGILSQQVRDGNEELNRRKAAEKATDKPLPAADPDSRDIEPKITWVEVTAGDVEHHMADSSLHLAVLRKGDSSEKSDEGLASPRAWELVYRVGSPTSAPLRTRSPYKAGRSKSPTAPPSRCLTPRKTAPRIRPCSPRPRTFR